MTYQTFTTVPEYVRFDPNAPKPAAGFLWSNDAPPPAIGQDIEINFNKLGRATVTGYFAEDQFLGLLVRIHDAPDWHRKQNNGNPTGHIFGAEIRTIFPEFEPGDRVEYSGCYVNARGVGTYIGTEREGSTLWHCVRINDSVHRVLGSLKRV